MKSAERIRREIEILEGQSSELNEYPLIPQLIRGKIGTLRWILEECQMCQKDISEEQRCGSEEICDECYQNTNTFGDET